LWLGGITTEREADHDDGVSLARAAIAVGAAGAEPGCTCAA
jgi:hypothetical protein